MNNNPDNQQPNSDPLAKIGPVASGGDQGATALAAAAKPKTESLVRDARLKAALKANMARRKGQARARASTDTGPADIEKNE